MLLSRLPLLVDVWSPVGYEAVELCADGTAINGGGGASRCHMRVSDCLCAGAWFTSTPRIGLGMPQLVG